MQLGSGGAVIPLPVASLGQTNAGGPGKFDFYCWKGHRLAYLFIFYVKFSAFWGIFAWIWAHEIITICVILVSWKIFVCETWFDLWIMNHKLLVQTLLAIFKIIGRLTISFCVTMPKVGFVCLFFESMEFFQNIN